MKFRVANPEDPADADTLINAWVGCMIEGDSATTAREQVVCMCEAPSADLRLIPRWGCLLGGNIMGRSVKPGWKASHWNPPSPKECTVGR